MDVLILVDRLGDDARPDETDVLQQAESVEAALHALGHDARRLAVDLDLRALHESITGQRPDLVFNLVESPAGRGAFIHLPLSILEALDVPVTGAKSLPMWLTSNKLATKRRLVEKGIPTAPWFVRSSLARQSGPIAGAFIIKSVWEHGSVGLDEDSVLDTDQPSILAEELDRRLASLGGEGFVERYIEGREFNLAMLCGPDGPEILPPAEILFPDYGPDRRRVVGYRAKWATESFEYQGTPRSFEIRREDLPLIDELRRLAMACWHAFELSGHVRVDFRVDEDGRPFVLEVNANPCLSPDAGFAAAALRAGIPMTSVMTRIIDDAVSKAVRS
ncbi:MAG: D-alanine--D-alanine ligase [Planctomycetes bacterium]|nr:D-alanine--D-alanine ligase [Planctomycetota bacterium]